MHTDIHVYMHICIYTNCFQLFSHSASKFWSKEFPLLPFFWLLKFFVSSCHNTSFQMHRRVAASKWSQHWLDQSLVQAVTSRITPSSPGRGKEKIVYLTSLILAFKPPSAVTVRTGIMQFLPEIQEGNGFPSEELYWQIEPLHTLPCNCCSCRHMEWWGKGGQRQPSAAQSSAAAAVHQIPLPLGSRAPRPPLHLWPRVPAVLGTPHSCPDIQVVKQSLAWGSWVQYQPSARSVFRGAGGRDQFL